MQFSSGDRVTIRGEGNEVFEVKHEVGENEYRVEDKRGAGWFCFGSQLTIAENGNWDSDDDSRIFEGDLEDSESCFFG